MLNCGSSVEAIKLEQNVARRIDENRNVVCDIGPIRRCLLSKDRGEILSVTKSDCDSSVRHCTVVLVVRVFAVSRDPVSFDEIENCRRGKQAHSGEVSL